MGSDLSTLSTNGSLLLHSQSTPNLEGKFFNPLEEWIKWIDCNPLSDFYALPASVYGGFLPSPSSFYHYNNISPENYSCSDPFLVKYDDRLVAMLRLYEESINQKLQPRLVFKFYHPQIPILPSTTTHIYSYARPSYAQVASMPADTKKKIKEAEEATRKAKDALKEAIAAEETIPLLSPLKTADIPTLDRCSYAQIASCVYENQKKI